jgi:hypothetical protein
MLIIALVLAVIGLAALVTAVVTSNELIAWVCIGASVIGVLLLIVDALRERSRTADEDETDSDATSGEQAGDETAAFAAAEPAEDYPDEPTTQFAVESEAPETLEESEASEYPEYSESSESSEDTESSEDSDTTAVAVDEDETSRTKTD